MLVVKHNPHYRFAEVMAALEDAAVPVMAVARRFPEGFPGPTGRGLHPRNKHRGAGNGLQYPYRHVGSMLRPCRYPATLLVRDTARTEAARRGIPKDHTHNNPQLSPVMPQPTGRNWLDTFSRAATNIMLLMLAIVLSK